MRVPMSEPQDLKISEKESDFNCIVQFLNIISHKINQK